MISINRKAHKYNHAQFNFISILNLATDILKVGRIKRCIIKIYSKSKTDS